ncbi:MAG: hypothetical protein ACREA3_02160 [Nitrosotalea sp.]
MAKFVTTSKMPKPQAKKTTLDILDMVISYGVELNKLRFSYTLLNAINQIKKIKDSVNGIGDPLKYPQVIDLQFNTMVSGLIGFRPAVSYQLEQFWSALLDMMTISGKTKKEYNPSKFAMENKEKILEVNDKYLETVRRFNKNHDDRIILFSLFYVHILKVETIEYSFVQQFKDELKKFNLTSKYDAEEIFSVNGKVPSDKEWITDGRAIRNCLGHNAYELKNHNSSWSIHFRDTKKGHVYDKTFTRDQFIRFENDMDLLYRSSLFLLFIIIANTLIKQHLLVP